MSVRFFPRALEQPDWNLSMASSTNDSEPVTFNEDKSIDYISMSILILYYVQFEMVCFCNKAL